MCCPGFKGCITVNSFVKYLIYVGVYQIGFSTGLFYKDYLFIELPENQKKMLYHDIIIMILNDLFQDRGFCPYRPALQLSACEGYNIIPLNLQLVLEYSTQLHKRVYNDILVAP